MSGGETKNLRQQGGFKRLAWFALSLLPLYLLSLSLHDRIRLRGRTLLQHATRVWLTPGGPSFSLQRFAEADRSGPIDIAIFGSSHACEGIDPHAFGGYRTFNLGSWAQTPLNSYYLMREYWPRLRPKLVVQEVFWKTLKSDGLEAGYDLVTNLRPSWPLFAMSLRIGDLPLLNLFFAKELRIWSGREIAARQAPSPLVRYVANGFVEPVNRPLELSWPPPGRDPVNPRQLRYLERIIRYVQGQGGRIVLVSQPVPQELIARALNFREIQAQLEKIAVAHRVKYYDLTRRPPLQVGRDFFDTDHLTRAGQEAFNRELVRQLLADGQL